MLYEVITLSLGAEVGSIGGEEDGVVGMGECADPNECKAIADLGVTMLAAGIGNIHGKYPANWAGLSFETLDAIQQLTGDMPLVLHGGTGIPTEIVITSYSIHYTKLYDITKHFIELRGIGIVDVKTLFGVSSVKDTQSIA